MMWNYVEQFDNQMWNNSINRETIVCGNSSSGLHDTHHPIYISKRLKWNKILWLWLMMLSSLKSYEQWDKQLLINNSIWFKPSLGKTNFLD